MEKVKDEVIGEFFVEGDFAIFRVPIFTKHSLLVLNRMFFLGYDCIAVNDVDMFFKKRINYDLRSG